MIDDIHQVGGLGHAPEHRVGAYQNFEIIALERPVSLPEVRERAVRAGSGVARLATRGRVDPRERRHGPQPGKNRLVGTGAARVLGQYDSDYTIRLIAFDREELFRDPDHLNETGAEMFSKSVLRDCFDI